MSSDIVTYGNYQPVEITTFNIDENKKYIMTSNVGNSIVLQNESTSFISKMFNSVNKYQTDVSFNSERGLKLLEIIDNVGITSIRKSGSQCYYVMEDPRNNGKNITLPCNVSDNWKRGKLMNLDIEIKLIKQNFQVTGISIRLATMSNLIESQQFLNNLIDGNVKNIFMIN